MATLKVSKLSNCKKCRFQADLYMCVSENTTEFITKLIFLKPNQVINNLKERRMSLKSPDRLRIALMTDSTLIINCPFQKLWDFMHPCLGFPGGSSGKEPTCQYRIHKRCGFHPWVGKIPWRRAWQSILVFWPGESHAQRSLVGYSPLGRKQSDTTE